MTNECDLENIAVCHMNLASKVIGSTPVGRTRIFSVRIPSMPVSLIENKNISLILRFVVVQLHDLYNSC